MIYVIGGSSESTCEIFKTDKVFLAEEHPIKQLAKFGLSCSESNNKIHTFGGKTQENFTNKITELDIIRSK